jgi:hypothetical protein
MTAPAREQLELRLARIEDRLQDLQVANRSQELLIEQLRQKLGLEARK